MIINIAIIVTLFTMAIILFRVFWGPTIFDRILAGNSFSSYIIVLILLIGQLLDTEFFIDIAITYALINFIAVIGLLRFLKFTASEDK